MIDLGPLEVAYQTISFGYCEPDEMRMNSKTAQEVAETPKDAYHYFYNATVVLDESMPDGEVIFVNNKVKDNPPVHLGNIEEKHWKQTVTITYTNAQPFCRL